MSVTGRTKDDPYAVTLRHNLPSCYHCSQPVRRDPSIVWQGAITATHEGVSEGGDVLYFHPSCAIEFALRLLRDVHEIECRDRTHVVLAKD